MTIKHIQDQVENLALDVARKAYMMGMKDTQKLLKEEPVNVDEISDKLDQIVKNVMEGKNVK